MKKTTRVNMFLCLLGVLPLLTGCLPKESVELRSGVQWEYVDSTHSKLIFDDVEMLGPAHISLQIRDDCIFGLYHERGKTSIFMFELKSRKLHRNMESYEAMKYNLHFKCLYSQMEILGQFKSKEKHERLIRGEENSSDI